MHSASKKGELKKLRELVSKNKKLVFGRDSQGRSPLHLAGKSGHTEVVKFFLTEDPETTKLLDNVRKHEISVYLRYTINTHKNNQTTQI